MKDKLKRFQSKVQSGAEFWLLCRIALWIIITPALLRLLPLNSMMALLTPKGPSNSNANMDQEKIIEYTLLLLGRQKAMFQRNCLKRCLVVYRYLRLAGEPAVIYFGVRKDNGKLAGHTWLEVEGKTVFDEPESYRVTYSYPGG